MSFARIGQFAADVARHAVPVGGIFGGGWHPVTAIGVYWFESLLLAAIAGLFSAVMQRRVSDAAIEQARRDGDTAHANWLDEQRAETRRASIAPGDVVGFHVGSMLAFGLFLGGVIFMLNANGQITEPIRWQELRDATLVMAAVVTAGLIIDLWGLPSMNAQAVRQRVDACMTRWGLFWLLGFAGSILLGVTGGSTAFFGLFAVLKVTIESYGRLSRVFGWGPARPRRRSVYDSPPR